MNGGSCQVNGVGRYRCHCPYGFTGERCESFVDWCSTQPCKHGKCQQTENKFSCLCDPGWNGMVCDVEMVSCHDASLRKGVPLSRLCNNGTCQDYGKEHKCICNDGFTGSYCQTEINMCESRPCANGATCTNFLGTYSCQCPPGFQGLNCELNIDDCSPNHCQNGGICHVSCINLELTKQSAKSEYINNFDLQMFQDGINSFTCSCPHGTLGKLCEINTNDCFDGACFHGGKCIDKVGGYECECKPGYVGQVRGKKRSCQVCCI